MSEDRVFWASEPKGKFAIWLLITWLNNYLTHFKGAPNCRFRPPEKMSSSVFPTWTQSYFNCSKRNRAVLKCIPSDSTRARPAAPQQHMEVQGVTRFAKNLPISGVGGHDSCWGCVAHPSQEKVFSEKNQHYLPGDFFSSIFSMYKSSCYGFSRLSSPH